MVTHLYPVQPIAAPRWGQARHRRARICYNTRMKIVVFDSDGSAKDIIDAALGEGNTIVHISGRATDDLLKVHADADIISVFTTSALKKEQIEMLPNLKCIVARSTGVDHIDTVYAKEKKIVVVNVPKYGARTVSEFTFALMLSLSRRIFDAFYQIRESGSFKTNNLEGFDLYGKTLGVIGTGSIGHTVVGIAQGFGMNVHMFDRFPDTSLEGERAKYVSLDRLLKESDIVSLHIPYAPDAHHLINREALAKMKQGAMLINTARGELVDTEALLEAMKSGHIGGAGLDVLEEERMLKDEMELVRGVESIHSLKAIIRNHVLIDMPRVVITPHIAFFSREAYHEILTTTAANIKNFIAGTPSNVVNV